jgi:flavodoxin I
MKVAIIYTSKTGNTEELIQQLHELLLTRVIQVELFRVREFPLGKLAEYDGIIIGTYTWGNGDVPLEMVPLYEAFERQDVGHIVTGVAGTGDRFYPQFCGAVDEFRDILYVKTKLAVTLKIELAPQNKDRERCERFVDGFCK